MRQYLKKLCAVLLLVVAYVSAEVTVENGGYKSVLVSFAQNVQPEEGKVLLEKIKESLNDASEVLNNAIGLQFSEVKVLIPATWDISEWGVTAESWAATHYPKPDFLVDGTSDVVFGKFPHAHQYASCGTPGHQIVIPSAFFAENNTFPKGTTLAREWLKYRYGVFDENGFLNDALYPQYYVVPGGDPNDVKITDCTNIPVTYDFVAKDEDKDCSALETTVIQNLNAERCDIRSSNGSLENVTSSIMYYQKEFVAMQHICGKEAEHKHNSLSPNKQNAFCFGKSIWEVVNKSSDVQNENAAESGEIQFTYLQETKPKLVVAVENTAQMKQKGSVILNAVKQIMIDLPDGSQFSAFPFDDGLLSDADYPLQNLNGLSDKKTVEQNLHFDFLKPVDVANINLPIEKALDILSEAEADNKAIGTIIIIARSMHTLDETLIERLTESDVRILFLFLFLGEGDIPNFNTVPEDLSNPSIQKILLADEKDDEVFKNLYNSMRLSLPSVVDDKKSEMVKTGILSKESPISVQVDDSVETVTFWVYAKRASENFELKFNKKTDKAKTENIGEVKQMVYSVPEAGTVELSFIYDDVFILTQVTTTHKAGKYISGEVFVHDTTEAGSSEQMPVIIYAFIRYGSYPVQNAKVSATVLTPDNENIILDLNDDGTGDPDITKNDGIYSRYFTNFTSKGDYKVTVTVQNNGDQTTYGDDKIADYKTCCGSYVNGGTSKPGEFSEELVNIFSAVSVRPDAGYKPSRIVDLRIAGDVSDEKITLKWTAPGGEADHGTAKSYEIKYFTAQEEAIENFDSGTTLEYAADPQERGETEKFEIKSSDFEKTGLYYIAMKTKNEANNTSTVSNIIELLVPEITATENPGGKDDKDENTKKSAVKNKTVGIVVGVIVAVVAVIILLYLVIYFVVIKPKQKSEKKKDQTIEAPAARDESAMNSITFIPASTLIEHHNEKTRAKLENKEPPIFKEEDFEDRQLSPTNEAEEGGSHPDPQSDKVNSNGQPNRPSLPPKSPKRTTPV